MPLYLRDVSDRDMGDQYLRCPVQAGAGDPRGRKHLAVFRPGEVHRFQATFVEMEEDFGPYFEYNY
jgi:hypothetical protein